MNSMNAVDTATLPRIKPSILVIWLRRCRQAFISWLLTWEIYPLLALALFTHFYQLSTTEFDADQAILFRLPHAAVTQGLIPVTGTVSSIGMVNPPGYVFLLMPIAAFTASPFADVIFTALLNVLAVLLTYLFTRRYYGRLAGIVAALLYTTTLRDLYFSRFIWQPNLLPFFVLLYMLALFRGALERKTGWLFPALTLLGLMLQLHATPIYLIIPLAVTLVLAYKTVRRADLLGGLFGFSVFFLPYLVWESATHFADLPLLLGASDHPARFDDQALLYYLEFLVPYISDPKNTHTFLHHFLPFFRREMGLMYVVTLGGFLVALLGMLGWRHIQLSDRFSGKRETVAFPGHALGGKLWRAWSALASSPQRCGLLLLLCWQIPILLLLSRHSIALQAHYLLILLPGPFILIGLFFRQLTLWCSALRGWHGLSRYAVPAFSVCLIAVQFLGSTGWFLDESRGLHSHWYQYNTWQDVQGAVNAADWLAQARHLHRVYIYTDKYTDDAFTYLAEQMKTPVTIVSMSHCLLLPGQLQGPAVALAAPGDPMDDSLLEHFGEAATISKPPRLGSGPFHLYVVRPIIARPQVGSTFAQTLSMDQRWPGNMVWKNPHYPTSPGIHLFGTLWSSLRGWSPAYRTIYAYQFSASYAGNGTAGQTTSAECRFSSIEPGEQLMVPFELPPGSTAWPTSLTLSGSIWKSQPYSLQWGPFRFESIRDKSTFQASLGKHLVLPMGKSAPLETPSQA